jgi:putative Mg2+ transporter-C (MgtC) family protein
MLLTWEIVLRLLLASLLGSVIGLERERLLWAAGLRTHMLVSVGACLIMIVSTYGFDGVLGNHVVLDPSRVAAQVVSGIGFLGAGSIILRGDKIKGLTTAASLWTVGGIGLAVGGGLYAAAISATVIILAILAGIKPLEERYLRRSRTVTLTLQAAHGEISLGMLSEKLGALAPRVRQFIVKPSESPETDEVTITLDRVTLKEAEQVRHLIRALPSVLSIDELGE